MCCKISPPEVKNLVIHFKVKGNCSLQRLKKTMQERQTECSTSQKKNFCCFKQDGFSYTVFPASGNIICTGIKNWRTLVPALRSFVSSMKLQSIHSSLGCVRVANSTFSGRIECLDLHKPVGGISVCQAITQFMKLYQDQEKEYLKEWNISFRSQFFPGIRVRHTSLGTVNLFNNGKYILIGVKSQDDAVKLIQALCVFIMKCWTTLDEEMSCVWTAGSSFNLH